MTRIIWKTVARAIPVMILVAIVDFFLIQLAPGDAADVIAGMSGSATEASVAALRKTYGLDLPLAWQFLAWLNDLAHFSFGFSPRYNMPVADLIAQRLPGTLVLMLIALGLAIITGMTAGVFAAVYTGKWQERVFSFLTLLFYSIPTFWIGLMMIVLFSIMLNWLPSGGQESIGKNLTGFSIIADRVRFLILPSISLALFYVALYARLTRASMLEVAATDFARTATAKGLSPLTVTVRHVLRNALIPVTTMIGLHIGGLMGGSVVVETVFNWPGLGRLTFEAVMGRDYRVLLGVLLLSSLVVLVANMLVDIVHAWLDPRIEA